MVAAGRGSSAAPSDLHFFEKQGDMVTPEEWGAHGTRGEDGQRSRRLDFEEVNALAEPTLLTRFLFAPFRLLRILFRTRNDLLLCGTALI